MNMEEPLLAPAGGGFTIRYRNRFLHSPLDPEGSVRRRISQALPEGVPPGTLLFVPSPGLGYGLKELLDLLPAESRLLCVESDPRLLALIGSRPEIPLPGDPRLIILHASSPAGLVQALRQLGVWRFRRVRTLILSGGYALNGAIYDAMSEALEEEIQLFWQNKITLMRMSRLWLGNLFENLLHLPLAGRLADLRTLRPILVAGAGPSLEGVLQRFGPVWHQWTETGRPLIAAVDTALPVLREAGLRPDLVFLLEAQAINLQDFIGWNGWRTPLVCDLTAHPSAVRRFGPAVHFFSSRFAPVRLLDRLGAGGLLPYSIPPLGSVGVAAVYLALELTRGPVLLAGLDFSYPGGRTHARGAPADRLMRCSADRLSPVGQRALEGLYHRPLQKRPGKSGRPVLTDLVLLSYARQLAHRLQGEPRVFDLGEEGLPLGARPLRSAGEMKDICASPPAPAGESGGGCFEPDSGSRSAERPVLRRLKIFLEEEMDRLQELRRVLRHDGGTEPAGLSGLLRDMDYLYLHFPEANPEPERSPGALARVLLSADYHYQHLARIRQRLAGG